jgi:hypothetical protein
VAYRTTYHIHITKIIYSYDTYIHTHMGKKGEKEMKGKTFEEFQNEVRECFDCQKSFKVSDLVMNIDSHYHCRKCADKFYTVNWIKI